MMRGRGVEERIGGINGEGAGRRGEMVKITQNFIFRYNCH